MISMGAPKLMSALRRQPHIFLKAALIIWRLPNSIMYRYDVELQNPNKTFSSKESLEMSLTWLGNFMKHPKIP